MQFNRFFSTLSEGIMAQSEKQREDIMQREYQSMAPDTVEDKNGAENKIKKPRRFPVTG